MLALYSATVFLGAALLFLVQPMFARMVLPLLGGSPAVWNTAVLFYQLVLLAGYLYAHLLSTRLGLGRQAALHALLVLVPLALLPIRVPAGWDPPAASSPIPWLLAVLLVAVGGPFFVLSTSSPLLQRWFAATRHRAAADPYFLYAASNVGSLLALVAYPALVEPALRLRDQAWLWALGYALFAVGTLGCALLARRAGRSPVAATGLPVAPAAGGPSARRRLRWVLLAFVPSSLMLSVTTYLTSSIAPAPLLWIVPLALYLLSFIVVFARRPPLPGGLVSRALPILLLPLVMALAGQATRPMWLLVPLHLATFFVAALACHGALAADRPEPRHLTAFYIWLSVGGALGGLFNALLAPLLFTSVLEYPLVLILLATLQAPPGHAARRPRGRLLDVLLPLALGGLVAGLLWGLPLVGLDSGPLAVLLTLGLPSVLGLSFSRRPLRFGLGIAALLVATGWAASDRARVVLAERSFFGLHRVELDPLGRYHLLVHGGIVHGMQSLDPARRREPLTYYDRTGPIGQLFAALAAGTPRQEIAIVGLGAGTIACYATPGQRWTFYEIDPLVEQIARDERYFSYLRDCAPGAGVVLGDARLSLARAPDRGFDLLVLDAYTSDAMPVHLMTREALALYLQKLAPGGVLAFNISSGYLELEPVLGGLAADAGLVAAAREELAVSPAEAERGKTGSRWAVMARERGDLGWLLDDPRWRPLAGSAGAVWRDDFSSVLSVFRWH